MRRVSLVRALIAVGAVAAVLPPVLLAGSTPAAADDLGQDAAYSCQYTGVESTVYPQLDGLPLVGSLPLPVLPAAGGTDTVRVEMQVDAPAKVTPGAALVLEGTATFTFGANATATNAATVFSFLSDSFGVDVVSGSYQRFLRIEKLTTNRSTVGSPVVTADWKLPEFLVPSTASGELTLSMPHEALATNPVSTTPESVAFTGLLRTDSDVQPDRAVACALGADQDTKLGAVTVTAADDGGPTTPADPEPTTPGGSTPSGSDPGASVPPGSPDSTSPGSPEAPLAPGTTPEEVEALTVLAAEPIPPQTVAEGLGLPPWVLLFGGAFVAGGLFAAVSSHRRLRQLTTAAAVLAVLVVVPTPLSPQGPAEAATGQAQVTMLCVYESQNSTSSDVPKSQPTGISISLDVPDSVAPGDVVTLTGVASVQAPEDIRSQGAALGFNQLDAISDSFSVGRTIGSGKRETLFADRWQTGKTAFSNPLVVRAPLYFPAFKVPDDASGTIKLELPRNEVLDRRDPPFRNGDTPPRVAVEFLASASGNGTSITYVVSCWRSDGGSGLIASIPVAAGATAPEDTPPAEAPGTPVAPGTPTTPGAPEPSAGGSTTTPTPTPGADPGTAPVVPGTDPGTGPGTTAGATPALVGAAASPAPALTQPGSQDVVLPTWLALLAVLLAVGGYGYAGWNHLRVRAARGRAAA